ncbi:hypothetical protein ACVWYH_006833 [Bradyrhizobium sp. GM24.11]
MAKQDLIDPVTRYPKPPFKKQSQPWQDSRNAGTIVGVRLYKAVMENFSPILDQWRS